MRRLLLILVSTLAIQIVPVGAVAQSQANFSLRENIASAKAIKDVVATSTRIPIRKTYHEMDKEEANIVRSLYTEMAANDEPPFPKHGLEPLVRMLHKAQSKLLVTGELYLVADVDADGNVVTVTAYGSPSADMAKVAASVLALERFKPALCNAVPCSQRFPFALRFAVE